MNMKIFVDTGFTAFYLVACHSVSIPLLLVMAFPAFTFTVVVMFHWAFWSETPSFVLLVQGLILNVEKNGVE